MESTVLYEKTDSVVLITLNRPDALNSINRQLKKEFNEAIQRYDQDEGALVAIITGSGRAFCAGRDLKERAADNAAGVQAKSGDSMEPDGVYMWAHTWKPLIAAVNGFALAGGWSIAQLCDIRIAAEDAKLGITESRMSLLPPFATILPKLIPMSVVLEMVFTAEPITAQRACEVGFVNKVVPGKELLNEARAMAQKIVECAPLAIRHFKELAYRGLEMNTPGIAALTRSVYDQLLVSEDAKEGPRAFAEKRKPQWKGK